MRALFPVSRVLRVLHAPLALLALLTPLVWGCGGAGEPIVGCEPADGLTPVCGFENPEDLAPLPGGSWIIVSQFPGAGNVGGSLVAYRIVDGRKLVLFPDPDEVSSIGSASWGSPDCPGPPDEASFSPHGLDVDLGEYRLAVVNHGEREAVEFFEMGHSPRGPALVWRGCTPIPDDVFANDVALLPDGGFLLTRMLARGGAAQLFSVIGLMAGLDTGHVLEWHPEAGFREVPESHGSGPNGVVVSPDGREIYFTEWTGPRLVRLRRDEAGQVIERKQVDLPHHPDNITWTRDGLLLVAGQVGAVGELLACNGTEGTCPVPFSVVLVNPGTLDVTLVLEHPATAQGAASVALEVGDEIFIGTYDGDRIARAPFEH
jgi:hypothetical protein